MYWVAALFDEKTEKLIKQIWKELAQESLSYYEEEIKNPRPHITLASYSELDKERYIDEMKKLYENQQEMEICFNTLGSFLNYGTLFFSPTMTKELMDLHAAHHKNFNYNETTNALYQPGKWIPHCTLANKLSEEELAKAFQFCLKRNDSINGKITEIALIEMEDSQDDQLEAPIIFSVPLKEVEKNV
ncbi:2'-5' RNA ligase family protein [Bacillus sp. SCS-153A]|uniref:2'-5' RNA ligase family protein n=1 Tax=Rossellomorea sedimentorum TaxID=3115294 RepID=UPI003906AEF9